MDFIDSDDTAKSNWWIDSPTPELCELAEGFLAKKAPYDRTQRFDIMESYSLDEL
jgi:hypothetical protein